MELEQTGRLLLVIGASCALVGGLLMLGGRFVPFLGRLPGDLTLRWGGGTIWVPIVTCLLVSLLLSLLMNVVLRLFGHH
jgi:DUF2905 family protein